MLLVLPVCLHVIESTQLDMCVNMLSKPTFYYPESSERNANYSLKVDLIITLYNNFVMYCMIKI